MLIIAITGKIGSGKSIVSKYLQKKGAYCIDMDILSQEIRILPKVIKAIKKRFGSAAFTGNELDTKKLRTIIFNDAKERLKLNNIMWPLLKKSLQQQIKNHSDKTLIIVEAAVILQAKWSKLVNKIIFVNSDWETRVKRIIDRDNLTVEEIINISQQQDDYETYKDIIDYQIINNDSKKELHRQVDEIFEKEQWNI
ncbi:dephospho-CoA kinase [Spiroplasma endosymbiont of Asaphidion curtum]|uniref:dephospho-CoA kinase n=1 Tax=Spiroplasma endosymbiont of Asaphidion curtum TaxID=3066281 RepID=UPI00313BF5FE